MAHRSDIRTSVPVSLLAYLNRRDNWNANLLHMDAISQASFAMSGRRHPPELKETSQPVPATSEFIPSSRHPECPQKPNVFRPLSVAVKFGAQRTIGESLHLEFLHVRFRSLAVSKYHDKIKKATLKSPPWLADLQTSAPLDGYAMENGEFTTALPKDDRIKENLRVILEIST